MGGWVGEWRLTSKSNEVTTLSAVTLGSVVAAVNTRTASFAIGIVVRRLFLCSRASFSARAGARRRDGRLAIGLASQAKNAGQFSIGAGRILSVPDQTNDLLQRKAPRSRTAPAGCAPLPLLAGKHGE